MKKYIAYLRAINVGGSRIIKMDDLRKIFTSFDLQDVQTYIQTGNVIFASHPRDSSSLEAELKSKLKAALGYPVEIFLRTWAENTKLAKQTTFNVGKDDTLHIAFLKEKIDKNTEKELLALNSKADEFAVHGREIFNLRHDKDKSIFSNTLIEKLIKAPATTRNWNTIYKIVEKFK